MHGDNTNQSYINSNLLENSFHWRSIGPFRAGRATSVAGHPTKPMVAFFGSCAGGVWKTIDGGIYWENISDRFFNTSSVGAITISESDPNVIYVGTGESCIRGNVSHGDGVYKSTDEGNTWTHIGLDNTRHISKIRVDPRNHNNVYVAATGHTFGPNEERGVFRSGDGGESWEKVLYVGPTAGAADLSIDPNNPRVIYASMWEFLREPWMLTSGGQLSGLYRTTNGGDTWTELHKGLPSSDKGRMGVSASPSKPGRVWSLVEATSGGLFISDDYGENWELATDDPLLLQRPFYFNHVFADPVRPDTSYVLNMQFRKTIDRKNFTTIDMQRVDFHDLWIDHNDPQHMVVACDGGASISFNGGKSWSSTHNQPTSQFYHVATDNQFPYRVYGTQQDNSAISVPNRSTKQSIQWSDCYTVGASECGHIAVRPDNPNIVYSGAPTFSAENLLMYNHETGYTSNISIWPEANSGRGIKELKYRFQWTYPIVISPHNPNILYAAGNHVLRSNNSGHSWEEISPDLTRNDQSKMEPSGRPITIDTTSAEYYCTIFALSESPQQPGVLWAGSDDGLVHISEDHGKTWKEITPKDLPEWSQVNTIELSTHHHGTAFISATRYKLNDNRPYLYKTTDFGKTWKEIVQGIPQNDFTRVIREDLERPGLLYVGTESGLYISYNQGSSWERIPDKRGSDHSHNLPVVPVYDIVVKDQELVVATHGRSFWILGNLALIRQLDNAQNQNGTHLFEPAGSYLIPSPQGPSRKHSYYDNIAPRSLQQNFSNQFVSSYVDVGSNPPEGVVISYCVPQQNHQTINISIVDCENNTVASFASVPEGTETDLTNLKTQLYTTPGINHLVWDMRYSHIADKNVERWASDVVSVPNKPPSNIGNIIKPLVVPGEYTVQMDVEGISLNKSFVLVQDPRTNTSNASLAQRFELLMQVRDEVFKIKNADHSIKSIIEQMESWISNVNSNFSGHQVELQQVTIIKKLERIRSELTFFRADGKSDNMTSENPSPLDGKLVSLAQAISNSDGRPTKQSIQVFDVLKGRVAEQLEDLQEIIEIDLANFQKLLHQFEVQAIVPIGRERRTNRHDDDENDSPKQLF